MRFIRNKLLPALDLRSFAQSLPLLALLVPTAMSAALPETIERRLMFGVGPYALFIPYLMSFMLLPFIFALRGKANLWLLFMGLFFLFAGIGNAAYGVIPSSGLMYGTCIFAVCALASKIQWSQNDLRILFWVSLSILFGLTLQVVLFSLGFLSIIVDSGFSTLGVEGQVSRVGTTAGAATGSAVILFVCGVFAFYAALQLFKGFIVPTAILAMTGSAILLTFSRGGLLLFVLFIALLFFGRSPRFRFSIASKFALLTVAFGALAYSLYSNEEILGALTTRGFGNAASTSFFSDNGRVIRYVEAYNYWTEEPILGSGLGGYYIRKRWLRTLPGIVVGVTSPHNVYLLVLAELGLVGFIPFMFLVLSPLYNSFKRRNIVLMFGLLVLYGVGMNVELIYLEGIMLNLIVIFWSMSMRFEGDHLPRLQDRNFRLASSID